MTARSAPADAAPSHREVTAMIYLIIKLIRKLKRRKASGTS